ncbi:Uncharacterized protein HII31_01592 [Pseudocercospora fuligena]|uniref:Nitrogen regulatory protein areA GATA-like domain-containing protein n=1 Tax=Pseudocercospora fuligena TaxID=685502 RepID=A0A8H6RUL0_9PEZI|nr:Uncharacterized protein HII31_01592 [Pseudocercospora fuligena]
MPFRPEHSLVSLEIPNLRQIDTSSVENLMGMWSLFSKTSHAMEHGKRLENLSWRLWNRETFCCAPEREAPSPKSSNTSSSVPTPRRPYRTLSQSKAKSKAATTARNMAVPALSTSLDSVSSGDDEFHRTSHIPKARPELRRNESTASSQSRGSAKHITPIDLQKMVISIKETNLEPIELPMSTPSPRAKDPPSTSTQNLSTLDLSSPSPPSQDRTPRNTDSQATLLESSASTVDTNGSDGSNTSQPVGSQGSDSSATEMSSHSIIRGFVPGGAPSSYRSQTNLASQPTPILKTSPQYRPAPPKKKGAMFTIGTSSGEDESSLDSHMHRSVLSDSLRNKSSLRSDGSKKQTSFKDEVAIGKAAAARNSPVFESEDEDEEVSESAIEDDDDSSDWEDSDDASGPSSVNEKDLFQRVDSRPNLTSRRSLLTTLMHEPDRAKALANAASRSTPAIRRSRTTTPNGPSVATSPETGSKLQLAPPVQLEIPRSKPIIMTTSNTHQNLALSPRTTRRNMLSSELTESLRKNLLWERQHRSTGNLTALKRRHTSTDVKTLKQHPEPGPVLSQKDGKKKFSNDYFHQGLGEYHAKGW